MTPTKDSGAAASPRTTAICHSVGTTLSAACGAPAQVGRPPRTDREVGPVSLSVSPLVSQGRTRWETGRTQVVPGVHTAYDNSHLYEQRRLEIMLVHTFMPATHPVAEESP